MRLPKQSSSIPLCSTIRKMYCRRPNPNVLSGTKRIVLGCLNRSRQKLRLFCFQTLISSC